MARRVGFAILRGRAPRSLWLIGVPGMEPPAWDPDGVVSFTVSRRGRMKRSLAGMSLPSVLAGERGHLHSLAMWLVP